MNEFAMEILGLYQMGDNFHVQMHVHNLINIFLNTRHYYYFNESRDGENN